MLTRLQHDVLCRLLERLDAESVAALAQTCKTLRVFCLEEPLWLAVALKSAKSRFSWKGSWFRSAVFCVKGIEQGQFVWVTPVEGFFSDVLYRRWYRAHIDVSQFLPEHPETHPIAKESCRTMDPAFFDEHYIERSQPVLLSEIAEFETVMKWDVGALEERYGHVWFAVWHSVNGYFQMELSNYLDYCRAQRDEDPIYLFDAEIGHKTPDLVQDYSLPQIVSTDVMPLMGWEVERPNYRWILMGPARSGSSWHLDPWGSSAWNLLISGRKRWALYPPGKIPPGVQLILDPHNDDADTDYNCATALQWFLEVYPSLSPSERPIEFIQNPGETVFIPHGWWHCVLNLDMTVSVTQNFISPSGLREAVHLLSQGSCRYYSGIYPAQNPRQLPTRPLPKLHFRWAGSLVRAAWEHHAHLREDLWEWGEKWMYSRQLFQCLEQICQQHSLPPPAKIDAFPFLATSNLLFRVHGYIIKLFLHMNPLNLCIQQAAESLALSWIRQNESSDAFLSPELVGSGIVDLQMSTGLVLEAPYVIMTHFKGRQLSGAFKKMLPTEKAQLAKELGSMLGRFHGMSTPLSASGRQSVTKDGSETTETTVEMPNLRSALAWVKAEVTSCSSFFQAQDPNRVWTAYRHQRISLQSPLKEHPIDALPGQITLNLKDHEAAGYHEWSPFVAFLKWRQRVTLHSPSQTHLPEHLAKQLKAYLPSDVASLLPLGESETSSRPLPVLLHGDLTNDNILVSEEADEKLCIVDFGDVGYGDPLYDFVSACISSLVCQEAAMEAFSSAYWAETSRLQTRRLHSVSYCVLCYALVHEDDTMGWLFEAFPDYTELKSLEQLQQRVFGVLDQE